VGNPCDHEKEEKDIIKVIVLWDVPSCSLVFVCTITFYGNLPHATPIDSKNFESKKPSSFVFFRLFNPEDRGRMLLKNVGKYLPDYMASYPRRQSVHSHCREGLKSHKKKTCQMSLAEMD
jgi:hypothetical protein